MVSCKLNQTCPFLSFSWDEEETSPIVLSVSVAQILQNIAASTHCRCYLFQHHHYCNSALIFLSVLTYNNYSSLLRIPCINRSAWTQQPPWMLHLSGSLLAPDSWRTIILSPPKGSPNMEMHHKTWRMVSNNHQKMYKILEQIPFLAAHNLIKAVPMNCICK